MDIRAAIKREERRIEKELNKLQHQLRGVQAAAKALGHSAGKEMDRARTRALSAAARLKISKAAKKRWAKFRAKAKKTIG